MGTFIKEQRMALGMTQQQLAEQLHITNKAISRWETGNAYPDISLLDDLAAVLSVSVEELCRGERCHHRGKTTEKRQSREMASHPLS